MYKMVISCTRAKTQDECDISSCVYTSDGLGRKRNRCDDVNDINNRCKDDQGVDCPNIVSQQNKCTEEVDCKFVDSNCVLKTSSEQYISRYFVPLLMGVGILIVTIILIKANFFTGKKKDTTRFMKNPSGFTYNRVRNGS